MRPTIVLSAATLLILTASGAVLAQSRTPPDTSVKALEPPIDVRRGQLQGQTPPMAHSGPATQSPSSAPSVVATPPRQ